MRAKYTQPHPNLYSASTSLNIRHSDSSVQTFDACTIEFEFQCSNPSTGSLFVEPQIRFEYIFGSDEYYEDTSSNITDAFAFFLNDENIALLSDGVTEVTISSVNQDDNKQYFVGNDESEAAGVQYESVEADGFTTKLMASSILPTDGDSGGGWNKVKFVIADVADRILDSWILIEAGSLTCVDLSTTAPSGSPTPPKAPPAPETEKPSVSEMPSLLPSSRMLHATSKPRGSAPDTARSVGLLEYCEVIDSISSFELHCEGPSLLQARERKE